MVLIVKQKRALSMSSVERRLTLTHSEQIERIEQLKQYVDSAQADNTKQYAATGFCLKSSVTQTILSAYPLLPKLCVILSLTSSDLETDPEKIVEEREMASKW